MAPGEGFRLALPGGRGLRWPQIVQAGHQLLPEFPEGVVSRSAREARGFHARSGLSLSLTAQRTTRRQNAITFQGRAAHPPCPRLGRFE